MDPRLREILLRFYSLGYLRGSMNALIRADRADLPLPPDEEAEQEFRTALNRHGDVLESFEGVQLVRKDPDLPTIVNH